MHPVERLNHRCFCFGLAPGAIDAAIAAELEDDVLTALLRERCPRMFAEQPVFVDADQLARIAALINAVEAVVALPSYRDSILQDVPSIARCGNSGPRGAFFGYDFHSDGDKLSLIEINTNAGGAMLNILLARAERKSCGALSSLVPSSESADRFEASIVEMFKNEWRLAGRTDPLERIAIVDTAPADQYLYPEFLLFQRLLERAGISTVIADPKTLEYREGMLWQDEARIDLVYNRLTDFYLEQPDNANLREAFINDSVVLTPDPRAHALYADKRRLAVFSDARRLEELGVPEAARQVLLDSVPRTRAVAAADAESLWSERRHLFFKPAAGFGSKAAYRGDKLTRRVFAEIVEGGYVAQEFASVGERAMAPGEGGKPLKYDLRAHAYDGAVQWMAARLYRGQTTNFRTAGGGFAPVFSTASSTAADCCSKPVDEHVSYVFVLDGDGDVRPLPHSLYVALARGDATAPDWAGVRWTLADWYVRLDNAVPAVVVAETYTIIDFDVAGRIDWSSKPAAGSDSPDRRPPYPPPSEVRPTARQRELMHRYVFDVDHA